MNLKGSIPPPREGFSCVNINQRFAYLYGGWDQQKGTSYNEHYILDLQLEIWV